MPNSIGTTSVYNFGATLNCSVLTTTDPCQLIYYRYLNSSYQILAGGNNEFVLQPSATVQYHSWQWSGLSAGSSYTYLCGCQMGSHGSYMGNQVTFSTPPLYHSSVSYTQSVELYASLNGFEVKCSNNYGGLDTSLYLGVNSGGNYTEYNYAYVTGNPYYNPDNFVSAVVSTYDTYTSSVRPVPFVMTILPLNTSYSIACCSRNSYGSSCGNSINTSTHSGTIYGEYTNKFSWTPSVQINRSLFVLELSDIVESSCSMCGGNLYYVQGSKLNSVGLDDLFYDPNGSGIPSYNCDSQNNGFYDAYRWDCNPKDGVLDDKDKITGKAICAVMRYRGIEHYLTCSADVFGKPAYALYRVGALYPASGCCYQVPFTLNYNSVFGVKDEGVVKGSNGVVKRQSGGSYHGIGGYEVRP